MKLTHTNNSWVKVLKKPILNVPKVQMKVNHTYIYMYVALYSLFAYYEPTD